MFFFLSYEWTHLAYHLPDGRLGRLSLVRHLRELHRRHHDPRLMKRWNFNITVPVFDVIRGTLWSATHDGGGFCEKRRAQRAA
jgi:sterol desaturase/sphingolipid hydroxylase (fatty acid hydroxylase superfamily)